MSDFISAVLAQDVSFGLFDIVQDHFSDHLFKAYLRLPPELVPGLGRVAEQRFHFGGPEVARVDLDDRRSRFEG